MGRGRPRKVTPAQQSDNGIFLKEAIIKETNKIGEPEIKKIDLTEKKPMEVYLSGIDINSTRTLELTYHNKVFQLEIPIYFLLNSKKIMLKLE